MVIDRLVELGWLVVGAVLILVGGYSLYRAGLDVGRLWTVERVPTSDVADVSGGDLVAVEGTTVAEDGTMAAPLSNADCVLARWRVDEFFGHALAPGGGWTTRVEGVDSIPFGVRDATGIARVDPGDRADHADVVLDNYGDDPFLEVGTEETPPERVADFLSSHDVPEKRPPPSAPTREDGDHEGDRRFYEATLEPGEPVFVVARSVVDSDSAGRTPPTLVVPDESPFFLSDAGRGSVVGYLRLRVVVEVAFGLLLCWFGASRLFPGVVPFAGLL